MLTTDIDQVLKLSFNIRYDLQNHGSPNMVRNVSEDDTLLGRGANPRTGCITPTSGGSMNGDANCDKDILIFNSIAPTTWQQRGDQWVSVRPDLSTPIKPPTTDPVALGSEPKRARTPSRFSEKNSSLLAKASALRQRSRSHSHVRGIPLMGTEQIPTMTRPESPISPFGKSQAQISQPDPSIRRKPVGESPSKAGSSFTGPAIVGQRGQHMPLTPPPSRDGNRSISMPSHSNERSGTDRTVDESFPRREGHGEHDLNQDILGEQAFPLFRSQTVGDLNLLYSDPHSLIEVNLEKALPCLPMSGGPYRQIRFESDPFTTTKRIKKKSIVSPQNHQQAVLATHPNGLRRRSHIADMMNSSNLTRHNGTPDWTMRQGISEIPNYDNPPPNFLPRTKRPSVRGPREMPRISPMRNNTQTLERADTDPYSTISTITNTSTLTMGHRTIPHRTSTNFPPQTQPPPMIPLPPTPRPAIERIVTGVLPEPPSIPPRSSKRSQMLMQTKSAEPIIGLNQSSGGRRVTHMGLHNQSNMTGMLMKDLQAFSTSAATRNQSRVQVQRQAILEPRPVTTNVEDISQVSDPRQSRRCSRCHDGFVIEQPDNTGGPTGNVRLRKLSRNSANAPEAINELSVCTPITECTEFQSPFEESAMLFAYSPATSATILNVENDLRDHSVCCPDCCKLDCHEGCLGHPSICSTSTNPGEGPPDGLIVPSVLQTRFLISPTSTGIEKRKRKSRLGLIKSIVRLAGRQRHITISAETTMTQRLQEYTGDERSTSATDMQIPSIAAVSPASLLKILFLDYGHFALNQWWSMGCVAAATGKLLLYVIYVYSKTGMFKVKKQNGQPLEPWELIFDTLRSGVYLWILISIAVIARQIAIVFGPMAGIVLLLVMAAYVHRTVLSRGEDQADELREA